MSTADSSSNQQAALLKPTVSNSRLLEPTGNVSLLLTSPGRSSSLAIWPAEGDDTRTLHFDCDPPLAVEARIVPLPAAVPTLLGFARAADLTPSLRAVCTLLDGALDLVARARVWPGQSQQWDQWRVGPLEPLDREWLTSLAAALPAELWRASPSAGGGPASGSADLFTRHAVEAFVDCWLRDSPAATTPAAAAKGWIGHELVDVRPLAPWLTALGDAAADDQPQLMLQLKGLTSSVAKGASQAYPRLDVTVRTAAGQMTAQAFWDLRAATADGRSLWRQLRAAAAVWPPLTPLISGDLPYSLSLDDSTLADLLTVGQQTLRTAGINIVVPADALVRANVRARVEPLERLATNTTLNLEAICQLTWSADVDGEPLTADELDLLARPHTGAVRVRGRWVVLDAHIARRIRDTTTLTAGEALALGLGIGLEPTGVGFADSLPTGVGFADSLPTGVGFADSLQTDVQVDLSPELARITRRLHDTTRAGADAQEPAALRATLRPYQRQGLAWLQALHETGLGGCLADDMGLGKTVQLLALHAYAHTEPADDRGRDVPAKPTLVVCPLSLMDNWEREVAKFVPGTNTARLHAGSVLPEAIAPNTIVLTTYGTLRTRWSELAARPWGLVVADEAQHVKNARSATAAALRKIRGRCRIALTGTPIENRLDELWAILDWATPGLLGTNAHFHQRWARVIEQGGSQAAPRAQHLAARIAPFVVRRVKTDPAIVPDLPPKTELDVFVRLTEEQAGLYRATAERELREIREIREIREARTASESVSGDRSAAASDAMGRRGKVLRLLTELKQICDHPALYLEQPGPLAGRSGKLAVAEELLCSIAAAGERALVFTQYVGMATRLTRRMGDLGLRVDALTGSLSAAQRARVVDSFQAGDLDVLVLSLRAGGTGLNLTAASHVVHYDRWWNPAVENQASDRAWRIGQDKHVTVHRLTCLGTLEEPIAAMLAEKRQLADSVMGSAANADNFVTELDDAALDELVSYRDERQPVPTR